MEEKHKLWFLCNIVCNLSDISYYWLMRSSIMREEEVETAIKVVVVGNGAVGKSSMIQRYCKGIFTKDYKKTIGVDFLERQIEWVHSFIDWCSSR